MEAACIAVGHVGDHGKCADVAREAESPSSDDRAVQAHNEGLRPIKKIRRNA